MEWFGEDPPTAVVTGGASGIGRAVCELLSKEGYRVAVADLDKARADEVAHHIDGYAFAVDVADEASVIAMFDGALAAFGGTLDALATPAGIADTTPFMDLAVDTFRRVHDVNVIGTFLCIREAAKRMRPGARICTVASVAGKRGGGCPGRPHTRRAKAACWHSAAAPRARWRRQGSPSTASHPARR
jgi:NAD(P)-dependent dehydrogenase (short-subunit alcohol dehydrogenase family)